MFKKQINKQQKWDKTLTIKCVCVCSHRDNTKITKQEERKKQVSLLAALHQYYGRDWCQQAICGPRN